MKRAIQVTGGLQNLAPAEWFSNPERSSFWLRIFSALFIPEDQFQSRIEELLSGVPDSQQFLNFGRRLMFGAGTIKGLKVPNQSWDMHSLESGQLAVRLDIGEKELRGSMYVWLVTPFCEDGVPGNELETKRLLDEVSAIVCAHTGLNLMRDIVLDGEVAAGDGRLNQPGTPMKMPQASQGPFLASQNGADISEITSGVEHLPDNDARKGRVLLALQLLNDAMRKEQGFFEYWTALEVVCAGKAGRIKSLIAAIYGIRNHAQAAELTGLTTISQWRHDFVHRGIRPHLTADIERYLQLMFLDLLRHVLGLPFKGYVAAIQNAIGYDLSPIGLEDKRTDAQKASPPSA